ncbi:MAG: glycoside hydrolase family 15 protein [Spirochaetia bacterium]
MAYQPIESYGLIGNMRTAAMVCKNGSIDWLCFPHFDSPSVFAAILDDKKGGFFSIAPKSPDVIHKQFYWPDTNVLVSRFLSPEGVAELIDFMPIISDDGDERNNRIIRRLTMVRGNMEFRLQCRPAFDYARGDGKTEVSGNRAVFRGPGLSMGLSGPIDLNHVPRSNSVPGGVCGDFRLRENESATFDFHRIPDGGCCSRELNQDESVTLFRETIAFWKSWISKSTYQGRWRETVNRSALTLKLLTFQPTGAIVAAVTAGLPERTGGQRNWDYRYTWIRDAAFTLYGLLRIGFTEEAGAFMSWIEERTYDLNPDGSLQTMYGIDGRKNLTEAKLDHLEGYKGSGPVRIGNSAYNQLQLDIYGELMDSVYLYNKYGAPISYDFWQQLRKLLNWVTENWQRKDEGIWEMRGGRADFTYSKLMCWVALDRGLRLADKRSFPGDRDIWIAGRDRIYEDIMEKGYSRERRSFVQSYGSTVLDAAALIMPLVFFVSPTDRRMLSTLNEIMKPPQEGGLVSDSLTYRYNTSAASDGLSGNEGTFNICSFWLTEALTRAGRTDPSRLDQARLMFEKMLGYANHLGLYSEETGPSGEALGNFPQAFTHLALISAAYNLDRSYS